MAGPTIEFLESISDEELIPLYKDARGLLFPGIEDFGIVMAEALGFGIPVIAYKKGGALDIVEDGKSGILFPHQTVASLIKAIKHAERKKFDPKVLRKRAMFFSSTQFKKRMKRYIDQSLQKKKLCL